VTRSGRHFIFIFITHAFARVCDARSVETRVDDRESSIRDDISRTSTSRGRRRAVERARICFQFFVSDSFTLTSTE